MFKKTLKGLGRGLFYTLQSQRRFPRWSVLTPLMILPFVERTLHLRPHSLTFVISSLVLYCDSQEP